MDADDGGRAPGPRPPVLRRRTPGSSCSRGSQRAIHRELWGPGVTNRREAVHHAHALVLDELGPDDRRVLDLGCGVGTAALYLADRRPVEVVGISISPAQVRLADRYAAQGGPRPGSVQFRVADFTAAADRPRRLRPGLRDRVVRARRPGDRVLSRGRPRAATRRCAGRHRRRPRRRPGRPAARRLPDGVARTGRRLRRGGGRPRRRRWAWTWSAAATCRPGSGSGARATGSSARPSHCSGSVAAARCGPTRWSAAMPCSAATSTACWSTACSASSGPPPVSPTSRGPHDPLQDLAGRSYIDTNSRCRGVRSPCRSGTTVLRCGRAGGRTRSATQLLLRTSLSCDPEVRMTSCWVARHRDVAVDSTLDAVAEAMRVDEHDEVELQALGELRRQRADPRPAAKVGSPMTHATPSACVPSHPSRTAASSDAAPWTTGHVGARGSRSARWRRGSRPG